MFQITPAAKRYFTVFAISTGAAIVVSIILLIIINTSLLKLPVQGAPAKQRAEAVPAPKEAPAKGESEYSVITERNLFRAKLQTEIPKQKTEREIEEEALTGALKDMILKGIWLGKEKGDYYAVIDKGAQKGVWTFQIGEAVDSGLVVSEIKQNSVILTKGDFRVSLKLFARGYERLSGFQMASLAPPKPSEPAKVAPKQVSALDLAKGIKKEGNTTVIPKALSDRMKMDNSMIMSAVAVKASVDDKGKSNGYRVVSVDKGSVAEKIGLAPGDVVQEVNGFRLSNSNDLNGAYNKLKNESRFVVKIMRNGRVQDLNYEIR
jgi:type II secretion system protein C